MAVGLIIVSGLFLVQVVFERFPALLPSGDGVQSTQRLAACPRLLHVASEHSLLHFLVANLLTGLVNLLLKRLVSPNASSRATALERLAWLNAHSEREYLALLTGPATGREWLYDSVLIALVLGVHSFLCIVSVLSVAALRRSFYSSNRLKSQ